MYAGAQLDDHFDYVSRIEEVAIMEEEAEPETALPDVFEGQSDADGDQSAVESLEFLMTSDFTVEESCSKFQFNPYEPRKCEGKLNFFWEGLDPDEDDLLINARKRPLNANMNWMCGFCFHWSTTKEELAEHMKATHEGVARFHVCGTCHKKFITSFHLQRHEESHKFQPKHPQCCYVNSKGVPVKEYVKNHYLCGVKKPSPTKEALAEVQLKFERLANMKHPCPDCTLEFEDGEEAITHYEDVHATIICRICNDIRKTYGQFAELKTHLVQFHGFEFLEYYNQGFSKVWGWIQAETDFETKNIAPSLSKFFHPYAKSPDKTAEDMPVNLQVDNQKGSEIEETGNQPAVEHPEEINESEGRNSTEFELIPCVVIMERVKIEPICHPLSNSTESSELDQVVNHTQEIPVVEPGIGTSTSDKLITSNKKKRPRRKSSAQRNLCKICKKFILASTFREHVESHSEEVEGQKYSCKHNGCSKEFPTPKALELHNRAHSGDRPFKCPHLDCDRAYNYSSLLTRHLRLHTGAKPYTCDLCPMRFHELVSLKYHRKKIHTGERPHKCSECERAFILSNDLKKHLVMHTRVANSSNPTYLPKTKKVKPMKNVEDIIEEMARSAAALREGRALDTTYLLDAVMDQSSEQMPTTNGHGERIDAELSGVEINSDVMKIKCESEEVLGS